VKPLKGKKQKTKNKNKMLTRYQTSELYNQVLDEPNMLECILHHMGPTDIVHLKSSCPSNMTRFHDTIQTVLLEKHEDFEKKVDNFAREVAVCVDQVFSDNRHALGKLFDFLKDNHMWYKEGMQLQSFDRLIERKLIEFALDERYSQNALKSLSVLFDIYERCLMLDDEDLVEYIYLLGL
jgi:hypothetical protein